MKIFLVIFLLLSIGCLPVYGDSPEKSTSILSGKIWDQGAKKFITEKMLLNKLSQHRIIILALHQDNPIHQTQAAKIIHFIDRNKHSTTILTDQIERSKQNAFAIFKQRHANATQEYDATGLEMLLDWSGSSPVNWANARPVYDMAMKRHLTIIATGFSRYEKGLMHLQGMNGLPADVRNSLGPTLQKSLPNKVLTKIKREINSSYCGTLPEDVLNKLAFIKRAQDNFNALSIQKYSANKNNEATILITSIDSANKTTGIPLYQEDYNTPDKRAIIHFAEVPQSPNHDQGVSEASDYVWYNQTVKRPNPCAHLADKMP